MMIQKVRKQQMTDKPENSLYEQFAFIPPSIEDIEDFLRKRAEDFTRRLGIVPETCTDNETCQSESIEIHNIKENND